MTVWKPPPRFGHVIIASELIDQTLRYLALAKRTENIAYWAGTVDGANARVNRLVKPAAMRRKAFVLVRADEVARVVNECHEASDFLVAQIHTHPGLEDHSNVDECGTVSKRNGFISLVVPFYAQLASVETPGWFGYELQDGDWLDFAVDERILREPRF
jgi:hypothetical protein